jgi:hypothetical protein
LGVEHLQPCLFLHVGVILQSPELQNVVSLDGRLKYL